MNHVLKLDQNSSFYLDGHIQSRKQDLEYFRDGNLTRFLLASQTTGNEAKICMQSKLRRRQRRCCCCLVLQPPRASTTLTLSRSFKAAKYAMQLASWITVVAFA
jgi:hypothetical protein